MWGKTFLPGMSKRAGVVRRICESRKRWKGTEMSTTRCATVIVRVLVRSRVAATVLTVLNVLLDTSHAVTALVLALAEVAVAFLPHEGGQQGLHLVDVDALAELLGDRHVTAGDPDLQLRVEVEMAGRLD